MIIIGALIACLVIGILVLQLHWLLNYEKSGMLLSHLQYCRFDLYTRSKTMACLKRSYITCIQLADQQREDNNGISLYVRLFV